MPAQKRMGKAPSLFRVLVAARDLASSVRFYEKLFGTPGRPVAPGRVYFDCGKMILGVLDQGAARATHRPVPAESLYFATRELDALHRRARRLGCLDEGFLHGEAASPLGEIVVRPWGERSFYATDPSGNSLCFVESGTEFTGSRRQIAALRQSRRSSRPTTTPARGRRTGARARESSAATPRGAMGPR